MEELITIENVDDILSIMAGTPIVDDTCFFFLEEKGFTQPDISLFSKNSASDTNIFLSKFLIEKGYKKYNAGLAIKMWINWDEIPQSILRDIEAIKYSAISEANTHRTQVLLAENSLYNKGIDASELTYEEILREAITEKKSLERSLPTFESEYEKLKNKREKSLFRSGVSDAEKRAKKQTETIRKNIENLDHYIAIVEKTISIEKAADYIREKMGSEYRILSYKGLKYEKCIYSFITNNIIKKDISPNFIPLIAAKSCLMGQMLPLLNPQITKGVPKEKYDLFRELVNIIPDLKLNFIITGTTTDSTKIKPLIDKMDYFDANPDEFKPVLFQAVYSLAVMGMFGIVHNDLHFGNVLIQTLPSKISMQFKIRTHTGIEETVRLYTDYVIKFFDWDRGYVKELGDNLFLSESVSIHQINNTRTKQDFAQFLCGLARYPNIWKMAIDMFGKKKEIPNDPSFYEFGSKRNYQSVTIDDKDERKNISKYFNEYKPKSYLDDGDNMEWVEVDSVLVKTTPTLLRAFTKMYPDKPIDNFDRVYMGFKFGRSTIKVYFSYGWMCQSLFDIKDDVLPSALDYILDQRFLYNFVDVVSHTARVIKKTYSFPTTTSKVDVETCTYSM